ncbi:hypothetical protein [Microbacterium sp. NPDC087589]|uniref:phage tail protein n=1 Tax=Microbacterium sp. NPDC087589 TaxID=3364191 RepID=UPI00381575C0
MAGQNIVISVLADTKKLAGGLNEATGMLGGLGNIASKGAAVAVGALAAVGVAAAGIGVKAVSSASGLEQAMGAMGSVFKDSTGQMTEWANSAASNVGLAKSEYAGLATTLGAQLKNMGVSADALGGQTNDLIGLGSDLAAQFGGSTSEAVSALSSLLRGERDPIERYGVSMNEAAVKAKLAEMGLSGLTGEAEKNAKLQATLALLYEQTADAQGAFSRESTTLAGAQQRLGAGTENLYATLGTSLLPAVTAVTAALGALINRVQESAAFQALTGWLTDASNSFADFVFGLINGTDSLDFSGILTAMQNGISTALTWLSTGGLLSIFGALSSAREGILTAALNAFPGILDALVIIAPQVIGTIGALITQIVAFLATNGTQILGAAVTMLSGLIAAVAQILPGIISSLVTILPMIITTILAMIPQILESAISLFTALVDALPVIIPTLITAIVELLPVLIESILGMIPAILDGAISLFTSLIEAIPVILPLLIEALIDLVPKIISTVLDMIPKLLEAAVRLFTGLVEAVPKIVPQLIPAILNLLPKLVGAIIGMIPDLITAGVDLIGGLIKGLWQAAGSVGTALLDIAKNAIGGFLEFLGIHSPSRLFASYGKNLVQGLVGGLDGNRGMFARSLDGLAGMAADFSPEPLSISPAGALSAETVSSAPAPQASRSDPSVVDLSASSARLLADLIARGLTVVLPGAQLAGSVGAHHIVSVSRGNA